MLRLLRPMRRNVMSLCGQSKRSLMKAVQIHEFGGPEVFQINEVPVPKEQDNEVLVEVRAAGINPVDYYIRQGGFIVLPDLPAILGKEVAGVVKKVGRNVKKFKAGDRVFCCLPNNGGYSEMVACSEDLTFPLSKRLSFAQGSGLYVAYFTAYRAVYPKCRERTYNYVFVHGASGAVGLAAVQLLKHTGAKVVGTAGSEEGKKICQAAGADFVFLHSKENYLDECIAATKDQGFDLIVENAAHINLGNDFKLLSYEGRVAVVGSRGNIVVTPRDLMYSEGTVKGVQLTAHTREEIHKTANALMEGAESGWINPIIEREFAFDEAAEAHRLLLNRRSRGKLVFVV